MKDRKGTADNLCMEKVKVASSYGRKLSLCYLISGRSLLILFHHYENRNLFSQ